MGRVVRSLRQALYPPVLNARGEMPSRRGPRRASPLVRRHGGSVAGRGDGVQSRRRFSPGRRSRRRHRPETRDASSTRRPNAKSLMNKHNLPPVLRLQGLGEPLLGSFQGHSKPINGPSIILGLEFQRTNLGARRRRPLSRRRRLRIIIHTGSQRQRRRRRVQTTGGVRAAEAPRNGPPVARRVHSFKASSSGSSSTTDARRSRRARARTHASASDAARRPRIYRDSRRRRACARVSTRSDRRLRRVDVEQAMR